MKRLTFQAFWKYMFSVASDATAVAFDAITPSNVAIALQIATPCGVAFDAVEMSGCDPESEKVHCQHLQA